MIPSVENDKWFLNKVHEGVLSVSDNGGVINNITGRKIGSFNIDYYKIGMKDFESNKIRLIQVHRLVWLVYKGDIPQMYTINHIDGNKKNNNILNLELATYKENQQHAVKTGLWKVTEEFKEKQRILKSGDKNPKSRFKNSEVIEFRKMYSDGAISKKDIMKQTGVCRRTVENMLNNVSYNLG